MITPRFTLNQTENGIILKVHAPYSIVAETEIYVHENDVRFHSSPYYLRLNLPGWVEVNDSSRAVFNADSGDFTIRLEKAVPGEHFPDLDMITKLLAPKQSSTKIVPEISVIDAVPGDCSQSNSDDELQWFLDQIPEAGDDSELINKISYGFANSYNSVFKKIESEIPRLVDLPHPDETPPKDRDTLRVEDELMSFNEGHYLADLEEAQDKDSAIFAAIVFKGPWETEPEKFGSLSEEDIDVLKDFPNKEYIMDNCEKSSCYLGIIDLVFAYAYDQRTTDGEGTVESGWTIAKLSPMLSWLQMFGSLDDLVTSCFRRSLCFPLFRHWDLSVKVLHDTRKIIHLGKSGILKCLLHIHSVFITNECQYILNQLYIKDYCIWIQKASKEKIKSLAEALDKFTPKKEDMGIGLKKLDAIMDGDPERTHCASLYSENRSVDAIGRLMTKLAIGEKLECRDSDDTTTSDSSYLEESTSDSDSDSSEAQGCNIQISDKAEKESVGRDSDDTSTSDCSTTEENSSDDETEECAIKVSGS